MTRQVLLHLRCADGARGVRVDDLVAMQEAEEAPRRGTRARGGTLAQPAPSEVAEEGAHREAIDALPAPRARTVVSDEERDEVLEVVSVGDDGVRREPALL